MINPKLRFWLREFKKYLIFIFGGGMSMLLNLGITYAFTDYVGLWHMYSYTIALFCELIFLFVYHTYITFRTRGNFIKFALVILLVSALNWLGVYFTSIILKIHYLISIILVALIISVLNYTINRLFVFKKKNKKHFSARL